MGQLYDPPTNLAGYNPVATAAPGDWFDHEAAERAVKFIEKLKHSKGRMFRKPFLLEPWQKDYVRTLFGWKRADGWRRYRKSFFFVARKNGKTALTAAIANAINYIDGENGAELYCTGHNKEQASILFDAAAYQVRSNPALIRRSKITPTKKTIYYRQRNSTFRALPANEAGGHGFNTHFAAYDEFHLYNTLKHIEMYDSIHTSTLNRDQPIELILTTAGWDQTTVCYEEYELACKVRDGLVDDSSFLPLIYEVPVEADWTDPAVWALANPNLGVSVPLDYLQRECEKAKRTPSYENTFRRLHLNQWTSQKTRWLSKFDWLNCWGTPTGLDLSKPRYGGLDLSSTTDLTAYLQVQRRDSGGFHLRGHYWLPMERIRKMGQSGLPVEGWIREGWLTPIPGAVIELDRIEEHVRQDASLGNLQAVGYDPYAASGTSVKLDKEGIQMVKVRQGAMTLSEACKALERAILAGQIDHHGDPILAWCVENVEVKGDDNGNIRPVKPTHGSPKKIDAVSAAVTALTVLLQTPEPKISSYESEEGDLF